MDFFVLPTKTALQRRNLFVITQIHGLSFSWTFTSMRDVVLIALLIIILYVAINKETVVLFGTLCEC
jgi:hypothetical protein